MITIPGSAAGLVLGFLLASTYGALFHLVFGGPIKRILLYMAAAWVGFIVGQLVGDFMDFEILKLGKIHLVSASLGAWLALLGAWWVAGQNAESR
ncbi:MAG: hypothetical protein R6X18_10275 [Chloroflexota bacterium]|jgi:hypothetical protein